MVNKNIKLNFFERSIAIVSPSLALNRAGNRMRLDMLTGDKARGYEAGRHSRRTAGWQTGRGSSANTEIRHDLSWLRERSRELVRDNPYAKKALQVITTNVVGTGIRPSIPKGILPKMHEKRLMNAWRLWAETTECDFNQQLNFYGLMALAWHTACECGDAFFYVVRDAEGVLPIRLKLLEGDYLDMGRDGQVLEGGNFIMGGIEFTPKGKRVAYWMFKNHPSEMLPIGELMSVRFPAEDIIHIYEVLRPGQVRGIPQGVSAFLRVKNLDQYEDAQLTRQMIAACFSVFITKTDPNDIPDGTGPNKDLPAMSEKVSPGMIEYLAPGEEITFASPPGVSGYDDYTRGVIRSIATGYLITYESISSDLSNVNFSSGRMGWLEMHRQVSQWQELLIKPMLCQPVWKHFLNAANLAGYYTGTPVAAEWTTPRREMIDPYKEAKGWEVLIRLGVVSRSDVVRQQGYDPEKVLAEIIDEQKEQDAAGMMLDSDAKWDAARVNFGKEVYLASRAQPKQKSE